jgi:PIN domain nuclease of toxin-antitoxin system
MRLLLDTCTLLWLQMDKSRVPSRLLEILAIPETRRFLSAAVPWEIAIKWSSGKLPLPCPPDEFIKKARIESIIEEMPIFESAALQTAKLPRLHTDPFDRIQISQAIDMSLAIATPDPLIRQYAVRTIWD